MSFDIKPGSARTLEDLWEQYQLENRPEPPDEKMKILNDLITHEEKLRAVLNAEQAEVLQKYDDCLSDLSAYFQKKAFIKGIRFATGYLIEALSAD